MAYWGRGSPVGVTVLGAALLLVVNLNVDRVDCVAVLVNRTVSQTNVHTFMCRLDRQSTPSPDSELLAIDMRLAREPNNYLARVGVDKIITRHPDVNRSLAARGWLSGPSKGHNNNRNHNNDLNSSPLVAISIDLATTSLNPEYHTIPEPRLRPADFGVPAKNKVLCDYTYTDDKDQQDAIVSEVGAKKFEFQILLPNKKDPPISSLHIAMVTERGEIFPFHSALQLNDSLEFLDPNNASDVTMYQWRHGGIIKSDVIRLTVIAAEGSPLANSKKFDCSFKVEGSRTATQCQPASPDIRHLGGEADEGCLVWKLAVGALVVGMIVGVGLVCLIGYCLRRRRRHRRQHDKAGTGADETMNLHFRQETV